MKRFGVRRVRVVVALAVFAAIVVGLVAGNGWGTLSSMGYDAVAYLCPLGAIETFFAERTMVPRALVALIIGLAIAALVGRAFCAWVCPVPPIQRFFHPKTAGASGVGKAGEPKDGEPAEDAIDQREHDAVSPDAEAGYQAASQVSTSSCALEPVGGERDGLRIDSRHGVLAGALLSSAVFGFPVFCLVCPVGLSIALVIAVYQAIFQQNPTISLVAFAILLLVEIVFFRNWCHKLCPMGALMSLVGARAPLGKPRVDSTRCLRTRGIDCKTCVAECPERLDPHVERISECTRCAACAEKCPVHAISLITPPLGKGVKREVPEQAE